MSGLQENAIRRRLDVRGQVQGVGFRPYVYRLAGVQGLTGFVANNGNGVVIEVEGPRPAVDVFEADLRTKLPPLARITDLACRDIAPLGESDFRIRASSSDAARRPEVTPDAALCEDCRRELFDPPDRRHRYPFINCTNCGPRYSIIRTVPYDRPATTMSKFTLCESCACEYGDPLDRRFHAQPNACPTCGPQLHLYRSDGSPIEGDAIRECARLLKEGRIVAIKGIGGYHLACRADLEECVARLRERKIRDGKPLAVMVPDLDTAHRLCTLTSEDVDALTSPAAPIVLTAMRARDGLAKSVAPGCRDYGLMLPYAPVHHLLFAEGLGPLVMTSANLSGQPLTYEDEEAFANLGSVADALLVHDREIFRPIDDSVVFTFRGDAIPIRRARGYAPRPIRLESRTAGRVLAVGGELKSTVCLLRDGEVVLSEHLGDLTYVETYRSFVHAINRLRELFDFAPDVVAHDLHPQYLSTRYAIELGLPVTSVQHHHAHVASVMAEWGEAGPIIGLACDGTGYGTDGAIWGCEILRCERGGFEGLGHLEYFPLVGGDAAAIETWRPAAALLRKALGQDWITQAGRALQAIDSHSLRVFDRQAETGLNAPPTSSLGRVFDAVSYLTGLCGRNRHEAEAAMALEAAAGDLQADPYAYGVAVRNRQVTMSVVPTVLDIADSIRRREPADRIAARFHETIARMLVDAVLAACDVTQLRVVGLSGGCFCNRRLLARVVELLEAREVRVLYNRKIPCGDGGISLGQAAVAAWRLADRISDDRRRSS